MPDDRPPTRATERRFVRSEDPSLSPEANRLLTDELQQIVGGGEVEIPVNSPRRSEQAHGDRSVLVATLVSNRAIILVTLFAALVVGGIVALATGAYLAILVAVALHALGTLLVTAGAVQLTTQVEHVAPETAARLEEEGVGDPDRVLNDLVEDFAGAPEAHGVPEVLGSGNNERTVDASDDPARATVEQRTALTPQARPGGSAGSGSAVEALPWWVVGGVAALSIVFAFLIDGGWALPLVLLPLCAGWIALQWWMARGQRAESRRPAGDGRGARRRLAPVAAFVVAGVVWFVFVLLLFTNSA
jgi:hypothetical protein